MDIYHGIDPTSFRQFYLTQHPNGVGEATNRECWSCSIGMLIAYYENNTSIDPSTISNFFDRPDGLPVNEFTDTMSSCGPKTEGSHSFFQPKVVQWEATDLNNHAICLNAFRKSRPDPAIILTGNIQPTHAMVAIGAASNGDKINRFKIFDPWNPDRPLRTLSADNSNILFVILPWNQ